MHHMTNYHFANVTAMWILYLCYEIYDEHFGISFFWLIMHLFSDNFKLAFAILNSCNEKKNH
jgi:hypothetical protein